jgi:predicted XRE-type DNA-binding protein
MGTRDVFDHKCAIAKRCRANAPRDVGKPSKMGLSVNPSFTYTIFTIMASRPTPAADVATVQALRTDVAAQLARHLARSGASQSAAARQLGVPQPTLSKIVNGHVADLSIELLLRVAVRAGLPVTLMTGRTSQEAGAFLCNIDPPAQTAPRSKLANAARDSVLRSQRLLTPSQRLEAFVEHNQLLAELQQSALAAAKRARLKRSCP